MLRSLSTKFIPAGAALWFEGSKSMPSGFRVKGSLHVHRTASTLEVPRSREEHPTQTAAGVAVGPQKFLGQKIDKILHYTLVP